MLAACLFM